MSNFYLLQWVSNRWPLDNKTGMLPLLHHGMPPCMATLWGNSLFSLHSYVTVTLASILLGKLRLAFLRSLQSFEPSVLPVQLPFAAVKSIRRCRSIHSIFAPQEPKSWHQLISPICHTKYFDTFWIEKNRNIVKCCIEIGKLVLDFYFCYPNRRD